jgi:hypothetical protein
LILVVFPGALVVFIIELKESPIPAALDAGGIAEKAVPLEPDQRMVWTLGVSFGQNDVDGSGQGGVSEEIITAFLTNSIILTEVRGKLFTGKALSSN